ncbi:SRPBCC family protein [Rhodococcus opacus]|uniref:SRPBCC family protein n=1 Tax=Rhodococcus opacus TaxID=37919 RepID=UPI003B8A902F
MDQHRSKTIDVGVPVQLAYNQWTQFADFPSFMKKVERVEQESDEKLEWKAQIFLSHRTWEATILEQVPDERIVWRSKGRQRFHRRGGDVPRGDSRSHPHRPHPRVSPEGTVREGRETSGVHRDDEHGWD